MAESYPSFPDLSRAPQTDVKESFDDPSIRDKMESGAVRSRPRYTRLRRTVKISYRLLSGEDRRILIDFVRKVGGWGDFHYTDNRQKDNPEILRVYFSKLPEISDDTWAQGQKRFQCSFEVTER